MTTAIDAITTLPAADTDPAQGQHRRTKQIAGFALGAVALAALGGLIGWRAPALLNTFGANYVGESAAALAEDLGCTDFKAVAAKGASTYPHHERGTCVRGGTQLTVITFDRESDVTAFTTMMNGVIPLMHPTWRQATIATGEGWAAFDTAAMSPAAAEGAVAAVGAGQTQVIPASR